MSQRKMRMQMTLMMNCDVDVWFVQYGCSAIAIGYLILFVEISDCYGNNLGSTHSGHFVNGVLELVLKQDILS
eukprot:c22681_g1_i1 orf=104-322(+)